MDTSQASSRHTNASRQVTGNLGKGGLIIAPHNYLVAKEGPDDVSMLRTDSGISHSSGAREFLMVLQTRHLTFLKEISYFVGRKAEITPRLDL